MASAATFTSGTTGSGVPAILVGLMLTSEFIGTSASVGTAQEAYTFGISAAWNIIALGASFLFYSFLLAGRYKESGHNTISGVFAEGLRPVYQDRHVAGDDLCARSWRWRFLCRRRRDPGHAARH